MATARRSFRVSVGFKAATAALLVAIAGNCCAIVFAEATSQALKSTTGLPR